MIVNLCAIAIMLMSGVVYHNLEYKTKKSYRKNYVFAVSILLILQSGLRNVAVGADTYAYCLHFENIKYSTWGAIYDSVAQYYIYGVGKAPGYVVFQKAFQSVLPYYQLFLMFIAVIFFSSLGRFIYKNTSRISDAVIAFVLYSCIFYNFFSITGHRQTIATAASLYGYELIKRRKLVAFLLLILLASTIHKSVLIFLPFYFIAQLKKTAHYYWGVLLLLPVAMINRINLLQIFQDFGGYEQYETYAGAGTYTFSFLLLIVAVVALWRMKVTLRKDEAVRVIYNAFICALIFTPLTWVNPNAMRVVQYYSIFMLVLVPVVINSFEYESRKICKMVYIYSLCLLIGLFAKANIDSKYKFFWQDMELGENYK